MRALGGVSVRPAPSTLTHTWHELRLRLPWVQAVVGSDGQVRPLHRASNAATVKQAHLLPFADEPNVYPESLWKTLDAHRAANRASLIHKIPETGSREPLVLRPPLDETPRRSPPKGRYNVIHLKFARAERRRGRDTGDGDPRVQYAGECRGLTRQWMSEPSAPVFKRLPWLRTVCAQSDPSPTNQCLASERLTWEILAFHDYILPTAEELTAAEQAITDLRSCVLSITPSTQVDLIGSRRTGLATPLSDLDFNVTDPEGANSTGQPQEREQAVQLLRSLWARMPKACNFITASAFVDRARVPIIIGCHHPTNLKFQIQCTGDVSSSVRYVQERVAEYPTLRPLYLVLRQMLEIRGLNVGRMGGMGSYPLLIMIVAALKLGEGTMGRREVGKQLCFFLDMFSKIDFYTTAISLTPLEYVRKGLPKATRPGRKRAPSSREHEVGIHAPAELSDEDWEGRKWFSRSPSEPHMMCLQDPSNPGHDLGKQVKMIQDVQALLIKANVELRESMDIWDTTNCTHAGGRQSRVALLDWCLGADHEIYEDERSALKAWARNHSREAPSQPVGVTRKVFANL